MNSSFTTAEQFNEQVLEICLNLFQSVVEKIPGRLIDPGNRRFQFICGGLEITYPLDETLFPPEIVAPTFVWTDETESVARWGVAIPADVDVS